jgi:7-cyano-7-deazaguanine synthase
MSRAVVLFSGGLDSSTVLYQARHDGHELLALSVDYGQRHRRELEAARAVAAEAGVNEHVILELDLRPIGGSALTADIDVPRDRDPAAMAAGGIPVTYVPARNTILLSLALGLAEARGAFDLYLGVNAIDYSGYPDCRPAFVRAFEELARLATRAGVSGAGTFRVHAPLLDLGKAAIVARAFELGVPLELTWSCYDPGPDGWPCRACDSCLLRARGCEEAGRADPALGVRRGVPS